MAKEDDSGIKSKMKETGKKFAKEAEDKVKKEIIKKIIAVIGVKGALTGIAIIFAATLFGVIAMAGALYIDDTDTNEKAVEAKKEAFPSDNNVIGDILEIEGNENDGKYKIKYTDEDGKEFVGREAIEAKLEGIEENEMNFNDFTEEEIECLYNCLKAEWATTLPNLGGKVESSDENYVQGVITVNRYTIDSNNNEVSKGLKYKPYDEFTQMTDSTALDYFSINGEKIVIATWTSNKIEYELSGNVPEDVKNEHQNTGENLNISFREIEYKSLIGIHRFPFELGLALMITTENPDFVNDLCELAFNSKIEIGIYENVTQTVEKNTVTTQKITTYEKCITYSKNETIYTEWENPFSEQKGSYNSPSSQYVYNNIKIPSNEREDLKYSITTTYTDKNTSYALGLNVESWFAKIVDDYLFSISKNPINTDTPAPETVSTTEDEIEIKSPETDQDILNYKNINLKEQSIYLGKTTEGQRINDQTKKINYTVTKAIKTPKVEIQNNYSNCSKEVTNFKYEKDSRKISEEGEKFSEIYDKYPGVDGMMDTVASWAFEMLEDEESTVDYVNILKYLLQIATGVDYGITEEEINELLESVSTGVDGLLDITVSGSGNLFEFICSLEGMVHRTPNGDFEVFIPDISWDNTLDISPGMVVAAGVGQPVYKQYQSFLGEYIKPGDVISKDNAEEIFKDNKKWREEAIEGACKKYNVTLTQYQIDAIIYYSWQWGTTDHIYNVIAAYADKENGGNAGFWRYIRPAENTYGYARDAEIFELFCTADYNNDIEWTSAGLASLDKWNKYDKNPHIFDNVVVKGNSTGNIIEVAEEIHTYMENNLYTYGHANGVTPKGMRSQRQANCISFVTWVYCEAGYIDEVHISCTEFLHTITSGKYKGKFIKIARYEDLQPGDIMFFGSPDHAELYAGNGYSYNAGNEKSIRGNDPKLRGKNRYHTDGSIMAFLCGYRIKQ